MLRRIVKYSLWTLAIGIGIVVTGVSMLYLPPVQQIVKERAIAYVSRSFGLQLSIEQLRLRFPLQLAVDHAQAVTTGGDTLFQCESLQADVALWPLVRGEIVVREFRFGDAAFHWADTAGRTALSVRVREFALGSGKIDLGAQRVHLPRLRLSGGDVRLVSGGASPDTTAADTATAPLLWTLTADRLQLADIAFAMQSLPESDLRARIAAGEIDTLRVDLADLAIRARRLRLDGGSFGYDRNPEPPTAGRFDPNHIGIDDLRLVLDSVFNRRAEVHAGLSELAFVERSGLAVSRAAGQAALDSLGYRLNDFRLQTPASELRADIAVGVGIASLEPSAPIAVRLEGGIGTADLFRFVETDPALRNRFAGRTLSVATRLTGQLDALRLEQLALSLPRELDFAAAGDIRSVVEPEHTAGELTFSGRLRNPQLTAAWLPDGFALPPMRFRGNLRAEAGDYRGKLRLQAAEGRVELDGSFAPKNQRYTAAMQVDSLPLFRFRPADPVGYLTLAAQAQGHGFDPFAPTTAAQVAVQIAQAEYDRFDYRNLRLTVGLADNRLTGRLTGDNAALGADLRLEGLLTARRQEVSIAGIVSRLDLEPLRLASGPASASLRLDLRGAATDDGTYTARLVLDSTRVRYGNFESSVARTLLSAAADTARIEAEASSGDLRLQFRSAAGIDAFTAALTRTVAEARRQLRAGEIDTDTLGRLLPPLRLEFRAARNNLLSHYLRAQGVGFGRAELTASAEPGEPFDLRAEVNQFSTQGIVLDTLTAGVGGRDGELRYFARMGNRPGNLNRLGWVALYGRAAGRTARLSLAQRDREGQTGLNFGLQATLADSAVTVNLIPRRPIFGFSEWTVNDDNYVRYGFDRTLRADLRLARAGQSVALQSIAAPDLPPRGGIRIGIDGIDIAGALRLLPTAPPVGGVLGADLTVGLCDSLLTARGRLTIDTLRYDDRRVGDVGLQLAYRTDSAARQAGSLALTIDRRTALTVEGQYAPTDSLAALRLTADLPGIPLAAANPFLPEGSGSLEGWLRGRVEAEGMPNALRLDGSLRFDSTAVEVAAVGTRFGVTDAPIVLENGRALFRDFGLIAPNRRQLAVNGAIDLSDFSHPTADLRIGATDFRLVDVPRSRGSMVFGRASADLAARVRGALNALEIRGRASLLAGTEVTYVMRDAPMGIRDESQTVVRFVPFNDTTTVRTVRPPAMLQLDGIDLLMEVSIDPQVQASLYLSEDGKNRIDLRGGGELTYSMNRLGDTRLAGRYELTGGRVRYSPPLISTKDFTITPGGYVGWTGELTDPSFSVQASQKVRTTVTMEDQTERQVEFRIGIDLGGSLEHLDVRFDLSAPEDLTLQNQLASLTPEQRQDQAIGLLIYNTYSGPGTSARVNTGNPINAFIAKELNQWAQNSLPGMELTFGVDSYDDLTAGPEGTRTDYSYKLSKKFFDNRVRISVGGKVSSGGGEASQNVAENLVGDISLEYQLSRRDNMYLKAFRETNFESILEGEVTETGIGFGVRKKVMRLGELFKLTREKPETRSVKRQERLEKRASKRLQQLPAEPSVGSAGTEGGATGF